MAHSEMRGKDSGAADPSILLDAEEAAAQLVGAHTGEGERSGRRFSTSRVLSGAERDRILKEVRDIDFPAGLRGYERAAVDRYVERVSRLITELEMSSSPEAAVRHALDEVTEETRDILQRAHQTADQITARSRTKADDRLEQAEAEARQEREAAAREAQEVREAAQQAALQLREAAQHEADGLREIASREAADVRDTAAYESQAARGAAQQDADQLRTDAHRAADELSGNARRESEELLGSARREADELLGNARREADELLDDAETRARELARNAEAIWRERRRLIDDMRAVGDQLVAIGEAEAKRFPRFGQDATVDVDSPLDRSPATDADPDNAARAEVAQT
jgi:DivIVA domain-containing protein